jgi:hypothetical protein
VPEWEIYEMMKARDRVLKTRWVGVEELAVSPYHADLYPLPRDLSGLRRSFERHGYRPEYPIVVRAAAGVRGSIEIVCGVGRHTVARERGMRRVPIVLRRFEDEDQARAYAIEDNLFSPSPTSRPSLAHMIVLARALKECGGHCTPRQVWEAARVSPSTYWRADASLNGTLRRVLSAHAELLHLPFLRQVAEIIRNGLDPQFTSLFAGTVEVNTYHRSQGGRERSVRRSESTSKSPKAGRRQQASGALSGKSNKPVGKAAAVAKGSGRKKTEDQDPNLSLLDLLSS